MNDRFEPSPEFVSRVMRQVREHEHARTHTLLQWLRCLAASGALLGMMRAMPVF